MKTTAFTTKSMTLSEEAHNKALNSAMAMMARFHAAERKAAGK